MASGFVLAMDPSLTRKTRKGDRVGDRPFYATDGPTSANIVAEARSSVRSLDTKRPFTPIESKRTLFGSGSSKPVEGRPPSAFRYILSSVGHLGLNSSGVNLRLLSDEMIHLCCLLSVNRLTFNIVSFKYWYPKNVRNSALRSRCSIMRGINVWLLGEPFCKILFMIMMILLEEKLTTKILVLW